MNKSIYEEDAEDLKRVLLQAGFVRCDVPACNCGSWHHRYGLPERWQEIKDVLQDAECQMNGVTVIDALRKLIAERDELRDDSGI